MDTNTTHHRPGNISDRIAWLFVKMLRAIADLFFRKRYGHRAVVLETVAAVPGLVGGLFQHLKALRQIKDDDGWIKELLDEAENERMHLMTFVQIAQPTLFERGLIMIVQAIFFCVYFFLYLFSSKTAHRVVGYFEEEAVISYTQYLDEIESGHLPNIPAPASARVYWNLGEEALLSDVVLAVREDEMQHRDRNHYMADVLNHPNNLSVKPSTNQPMKTTRLLPEATANAIK